MSAEFEKLAYEAALRSLDKLAVAAASLVIEILALAVILGGNLLSS
jgi:hypothetical protein